MINPPLEYFCGLFFIISQDIIILRLKGW